MPRVEVIKPTQNAKSLRQHRGQKKLRVAAYCRVSTDHDDQKESYDSQCRHYTDLIQNNKEWEMVRVYADEAISGTSIDKREDFKQMISDCLAGKIDFIITNIKTPHLIQSQTRVQTSEVLATRAFDVFCCPATAPLCQ